MNSSPLSLKPKRRLMGGIGPFLTAFFLGVFYCAWASAATPEIWKEITYSYREMPDSLGKQLRSFGKAMRVRLEVTSPKIMDLPPLTIPTASTPIQFIERIAATYNLVWFVYSGTLYVCEAADQVQEKIQLVNVSTSSARQALMNIGVFEGRFGWGELGDSSVVVFGPRAYIRLVQAVLNKKKENTSSPEPQLMMFRLKHASAADTSTNVRGVAQKDLGVASVLNNLLNPQSKSPFQNPLLGDNKGFDPFSSPRQGIGGTDKTNVLGNEPGIASALDFADPKRRHAFPIIDAYPPLNAVMVFDLTEKRGFYEEILNGLDVPVRRLEILATIVDADVGTLRDWSASLVLGNADSSISTQPGGQAPLSSISATGTDPTLVLLSSSRLALTIRSLEAEGRVRVQARPSVLTMDNHTAVLDLNQSAYFSLIGERTTDLKSVTVGTLFQVTPRVIEDRDDADIFINVNIEDGTFQSTGGSGSTPTANRNVISTNAVLGPNQSLVIGGYQHEQDQVLDARIPVLSSIPFLGELFKTKSVTKSRRERIFVLTARVIGRDVAPTPSAIGLQEPVIARPANSNNWGQAE